MSRITVRELIVNACDEARLVNRSQPIPGSIFLSAYTLLQKRLSQYSNTNLLSFNRKEITIEPENWIEKNNYYIKDRYSDNVYFENMYGVDGTWIRLDASDVPDAYIVKENGSIYHSVKVAQNAYAWFNAGSVGDGNTFLFNKKNSNKDFIVGTFVEKPEYEGRIEYYEDMFGGGAVWAGSKDYLFSKKDRKMYKKATVSNYEKRVKAKAIVVNTYTDLPVIPESGHSTAYSGYAFYCSTDNTAGYCEGVTGDEQGTIYSWVVRYHNPSQEWLNANIYAFVQTTKEPGWVYVGNGYDYFESYPDIELADLQEVTRFYLVSADSTSDYSKELNYLSYEDIYDPSYSKDVYSVLPLNDAAVKIYLKRDYTGQSFNYKVLYNKPFIFDQDSELNVPRQFVALFTAGLVYDLAVQYPRLSDNTVSMLKLRLEELEENVRRSSVVNKLILRDSDHRNMTYSDFVTGKFLGL